MIPHLEVGHLPSSSSFYSAVVGPLRVVFLKAEDDAFPFITFGDKDARRPLFEIREVVVGRSRPLVPSHLTISAPSAEAADEAYQCALREDAARESSRRHPLASWPATTTGRSAIRTVGGGGKIRVRIVDIDGNTMDIVYRPPPDYPPRYGGSTVRRTQSTNAEASRILDWNYDVATSDLLSAIGPESRAGSGSTRTASRRPYSGRSSDEPYTTLRRSVTDGMSGYESTSSPRQHSGGINAGTVVGALLGVAAGAAIGGALTYNMVKSDRSDRSRAPSQDFDPPTFPRRSTFPEPYPERKRRHVDVERAVEKVRYTDEYATTAPDRRPAPDYIARYSQAGTPRSRESYDDLYDERGRHHGSRSRTSSGRTRSEATSHRQPLLLEEAAYRSQASTKPPRHPPIVQRSYTYDPPERENYGSGRSQRPPPPPEMLPRSRSGSRMTTATLKVAGNSTSPRSLSRANTYAVVRNVPLPASGAGSGHGSWEDDEVMPDDSISNVGSRSRGGRAYH